MESWIPLCVLLDWECILDACHDIMRDSGFKEPLSTMLWLCSPFRVHQLLRGRYEAGSRQKTLVRKVVVPSSHIIVRTLLTCFSMVVTSRIRNSRQNFPEQREVPSSHPSLPLMDINTPSSPDFPQHPPHFFPARSPTLIFLHHLSRAHKIHAESRSIRSTASFENPTYIRLARNTFEGFTSRPNGTFYN